MAEVIEVIEEVVEVIEVVEDDGTVIEVIDVITEIIEVIEAGPQGPPGPPGVDGGDFYLHPQDTPSASWLIEHEFGRPVHVTIIDSAGRISLTDVEQHHPFMVATATFPAPITGTALAS